MADNGFGGITENKQPDDSGVMGMIARKRKETQDALKAIQGAARGPGSPTPATEGDYQDIAGRWHKKGSLD